MNERSLPPGDRADGPDAEPSSTPRSGPPPKTKPYDAELQARTKRYLEHTLFDWQRELLGTDRELTLKALAAEAGYSPSMLHQYLKGAPVGDVPKLETRLRSILRAAELRLLLGVKTVPCAAADQVAAGLRTISRSNQIGFIFGEAGEGKTRGVAWYVDPLNPRGNHAALVVTLDTWACDAAALGQRLLDAYGREAWTALARKGQGQRIWEFLATKLAGSNRLLIVDNAHKLARPAVATLCDFYDRTACPIGLVGNPELLEKFDENDQRFSRVGYRKVIGGAAAKPAEREPLVRHLLREVTPEAEAELFPPAFDVAAAKGHYRVLEKILQLAVSFKEGDPQLAWAKCFAAAQLHIARAGGAQ